MTTATLAGGTLRGNPDEGKAREDGIAQWTVGPGSHTVTAGVRIYEN